MMVHYLLTGLFSLLLVSSSQAQTRRAVMEALASSNNAIYISSVTNNYVQAGGSLTVKGSILGGSSVTANAFFGDGSHLTGIGVGDEGAVQYIKDGDLYGSTRSIHYNDVTGTLGLGVSTATTRGIMVSSSVISELKLCSMAGGPNCGGVFSAASGINIYTTVEADGSLRFNSAGANRGGFSTGGALYLGTDPIVGAGTPGDLYVNSDLFVNSQIRVTEDAEITTTLLVKSTMTTHGGLVLPQFSLATLRAIAPSVVNLLVLGPSPTYDTYVATGTGVGQWINQRTQVGP